MLITFKSRADGDVIMLGQSGNDMLHILDKDNKDGKGIIQTSQLDTCIAKLQQAIDEDKKKIAESSKDNLDHHNGMVHLSQRAVPLLDMLKRAKEMDVTVTWES